MSLNPGICVRWLGTLAPALACATSGVAQPFTFTAGNIIVQRMGGDANYAPGAAALTNTATAGFLDQFLPSTANQTSPIMSTGTTLSVALPTTVGTLAITDSGTATSNGQFTRSVDGLTLLVGGYNAAVATTGVSASNPATINRSIGLVTGAGINSTNGFSDGPTNNFRSLASVDGSALFASTAGSATTAGILLKNNTGSVTTTTPILNGNTRVVRIANGSLFATSSSATPGVGIHLVGVAGSLPGSLTTATILPGTGVSGTGTPSPYGIALFDNPLNVNDWNSTGLDTLYVADDRASTAGGGIQRWVYNGTTWVFDAAVASGVEGARGLAATINGNTVSLYATTSATTNSLIAVSDTLTASSGTFSPLTLLATAPANTAFRGVDFAPVPEPATVLGIAAAGFGVAGMIRRRFRKTVAA